MDSLTIYLALALMAGALALAATAAGIRLELAPFLATRLRMRALRHEVATLVAEHETRPPNRPAPRAGHCPGDGVHGCGRFAHITSRGEWGVRTRCKAHGVRLRRAHLIGAHEPPQLVMLSPLSIDTGPIRIAEPVVELSEAIRPTYRLADSLDILAAGIPLTHIRPLAA